MNASIAARPTATPKWTVDGWTGNSIDAAGVDWFVHTDSGWFDPVPVRQSLSDRPAGHGSYAQPNLRGSRVITLAGYAEAPDELAADAAIDEFNALLGDGLLHRLDVIEPVQSRSAWVQLGDTPLLTRTSPVEFDWQLSLVAPDPRKFSTDTQLASTLLANSGSGGVEWNGPDGAGVQWNGPDGSGLQFGTPGEAGVLVLDNQRGTAPADIVFRFTGPAVNPVLQRVDTGDAIAYGGTLLATDTLIIDTGSGAVRLGSINARPRLTRADLFRIPPRSSVSVVFNSDSTSGTSSLSAEWHTATW